MEKQIPGCEHRWRYFVEVRSRSVRAKECEHCGHRGIVPTAMAPLPRAEITGPPRLSA